jgi:hypothetical protein
LPPKDFPLHFLKTLLGADSSYLSRHCHLTVAVPRTEDHPGHLDLLLLSLSPLFNFSNDIISVRYGEIKVDFSAWTIGMYIDMPTFCYPHEFFQGNYCFERTFIVDNADINGGQRLDLRVGHHGSPKKLLAVHAKSHVQNV